ncbi:hypothetical protein HBB16_04180 [Pseudonocardia sp. MCCB 268]|nr:hypothetical protein [Pseudonocardia cytotoxica]
MHALTWAGASPSWSHPGPAHTGHDSPCTSRTPGGAVRRGPAGERRAALGRADAYPRTGRARSPSCGSMATTYVPGGALRASAEAASSTPSQFALERVPGLASRGMSRPDGSVRPRSTTTLKGVFLRRAVQSGSD